MKTLAFLTVILIGGILWHRRRQHKIAAKSSFKQTRFKNTKTRYRCVMIEPGLISCKAANTYRDKAILMDEAPTLPLSACDQKSCHCKFLRYDDRRMDERRSELHVARQIMADQNNQRTSSRRQSSDS